MKDGPLAEREAKAVGVRLHEHAVRVEPDRAVDERVDLGGVPLQSEPRRRLADRVS